MTAEQRKLVRYLNEAHASEQALVSVLTSQIATAPRGTYREGLESHLTETRDHAERVAKRAKELGAGSNPFLAAVGLAETVVGQALAFTKTPIDLIRGSGGEEKVLKNAKDAAATEALEIATYTAIERLARGIGDTKTAQLAASIRADEEKMLARILREIPKLTDAVAKDIKGEGTYKVTETGAADTARKTAKRAARQTRKSARTARKVPGVARAEGTAKGAVASASDLAIPRYDSLPADEIAGKLSELSQVDLAKVKAYERKKDNRATVLSRIDTLQADEPWTGYDELNVDEIRAVVSEADELRVKRIRAYERAHKARAGVLEATDRELANA
ncbi:MAG: hypothetical protein QOF76_625 [Solirubrobacteraceae bacterium]|jgi:ferritin-like metal-binding protein YciE|nr:hypothetical protein [Solirubrobacteraceae bacterium]